MDRTEIATRVLESLLTTNEFSYDSTAEAAYDAVEVTDKLLELLARPAGTVTVGTYQEDLDRAEQAAEAAEEATTTAVATEAQDTTKQRRSFFGF